MTLYTDDDVNAVYQFAWDVHESGGKGYLSFNAAEAILAPLARAVAARALRDFAAEWAEWVASDAPQTRGGAAYRARARADEIEAAP